MAFKNSDLTITDIARAAGVSVSTVSRILNHKQDVSAETRARVQQVIDQLGYKQHAQAARLRAGRTRTIAFIYPLNPQGHPLNKMILDFLYGAASAAGEQNYFFNVITSPLDADAMLSLYRSAQVDGLVLMEIDEHDWRVDLLREAGCPFSMIGHGANNTGVDFVDLDFHGGIMMAFDHLVELGHQHIGVIGWSGGLRGRGYSARTLRGYNEALERHELPRLYESSEQVEGSVAQAAQRLLEASPQITALYVPHDLLSMGLLPMLRERGLAVPDDISLVTVMSEALADTTQLTTIVLPGEEMGRLGVELLIRRLEQPDAPVQHILIPPRLLLRGSTRAVSQRSSQA